MREGLKMVILSVRSYRTLPNPPAGFKLGDRFELVVVEGTTLAQFIERDLAIPQDYVELVVVNGKIVSQNYVFQPHDRVDLFPPNIGG